MLLLSIYHHFKEHVFSFEGTHLNSPWGAGTEIETLIYKGGMKKEESANTGLRHYSKVTVFLVLPLRQECIQRWS